MENPDPDLITKAKFAAGLVVSAGGINALIQSIVGPNERDNDDLADAVKYVYGKSWLMLCLNLLVAIFFSAAAYFAIAYNILSVEVGLLAGTFGSVMGWGRVLRYSNMIHTASEERLKEKIYLYKISYKKNKKILNSNEKDLQENDRKDK